MSTICDQLKAQLDSILAQQNQFWDQYQAAYMRTVSDQVGCILADTFEPLTNPGPPAMTGGVPYTEAQAQARLNQLRAVMPQTPELTQMEGQYIQVINDLRNQNMYFSLYLGCSSQIAVIKRLQSQNNCGTAIAQ